MKFSYKCIAIIFTPLLLMNVSCSSKENGAAKTKLVGDFTRSIETYEMESDGNIYYVNDPDEILMKYSEKINQNSYYKNFEVCVIGTISNDGSYGNLGKYKKQFTVDDIC